MRDFHNEYNDGHLCKHCGQKFIKHGSYDNPHRPFACPASKEEPRWPWSIEDQTKAGQVFDKRMQKHWTKLTTSFEPVR